MKKSLMVLGFALCATFAFAQTNQSAVRTARFSDMNAAVSKSGTIQNTGYKGSIFTKTGELLICDFHADNTGYTTGTIGANQSVNGTVVPQHTQNAPHSTWRRVADSSLATGQALYQTGLYPATTQYIPVTATNPEPFWSGQNMNSESVNNGFMLMTMQDQIAQWGGTGATGNFDAYIAFPSVDASQIDLVRVQLYQYYRCFNRDQNWIDYSTNGTTWSATEFNVRGVDVETNVSLRGYVQIALPRSFAHQSSVYTRIRWSSNSRVGGAYGYFWMVDDYSVSAAPDNDLVVKSSSYYEGVYGLTPKGLNLPVVWAADLQNNGVNDQLNVTADFYAWMDDSTPAVIATRNIGSVVSAPGTTVTLAIDPLNWYNTSGFWDMEEPASTRYTGEGPNAHLPNTTVGTGHFFANITTSNYYEMIYGDTATFDTIAYNVTSLEDSLFTWGRDNGVLRKFSRWVAGYVDGNPEDGYIWSDDPDEVLWSDAGYGVMVSYVTGNTVPQGWRILGVEMVPSTYYGFRSAGAKIDPILWLDSAYGDYVSFKSVNHGASTYTVTSADILGSTQATREDFDELEFLTYGNYPTIYIPFPEQPAVQPLTSYRVGYQLVEDANFALAMQNTGYYYNLDSMAVRFDTTPGMEAFSHASTFTCKSTIYVIDPFTSGGHWIGGMTTYPMIRLVLGPAYFIRKYAISFECGTRGEILNMDYDNMCGGVDSCAEGSAHSYYIMPLDDTTDIDEVFIDGVSVDFERRIGDDDHPYAIVNIQNIHENHVISVTYKDWVAPVGIDPVAGVSLKLQPNPATSNVQLTLSGVSGKVNYAIIDMSGRVVATSNFNAETGANINVSNLAKGAYFVRITNDKFSKVEKLIVR